MANNLPRPSEPQENMMASLAPFIPPETPFSPTLMCLLYPSNNIEASDQMLGCEHHYDSQQSDRNMLSLCHWRLHDARRSEPISGYQRPFLSN